MSTNINDELPLDQVLHGDSLDVLASLPPQSVDLIFADPPYNLQLQQKLLRPNNTEVDGVDEAWDRFDTLDSYDEFTRAWLAACRRVLKDSGTLWVIGTYHNIYRVGAALMDLDYWLLNEVVWVKANPTPHFRGVRFANAHETLIWAQKCKGEKYTFNYWAMKALNDDLQMRSDWVLPICSGGERLKLNGKKAHPTQKPEALLYRIILSSSNPGDVVLDPFFGTGTTGAVARQLRRHYIGIEKERHYVELARERLNTIQMPLYDEGVFVFPDKRSRPRIPFGALIENGLLAPGATLRFGAGGRTEATVLSNGHLRWGETTGSIHQVGKAVTGAASCNGWEHWHYHDAEAGAWRKIDVLRERLRRDFGAANGSLLAG